MEEDEDEPNFHRQLENFDDDAGSEEEEEEEGPSGADLIARAQGAEITAEQALELQRTLQEEEGRGGGQLGQEILGRNRSLANKRLTTHEQAKVLIVRAQQLANNAPSPLDKDLVFGSYLTTGMTPEQYKRWYARIVLDPAALAALELQLGYLDHFVVIKEYPDGRFERWTVGELLEGTR